MKVEQDTQVSRPPVHPARRRKGSVASADWAGSPSAQDTAARLAGDAPRLIARAPGRLDVIGGLSDYTGASVVFTTLGEHACVAVQLRSDGRISIAAPGPGDDTPTVIHLASITEGGCLISSQRGRDLIADEQARTARCVLGAILEMLRAGIVADPGDGLSVVVGPTLDSGPATGGDASVAAATLVAAAAALDVVLDPLAAAGVCQTVQNEWLGAPVGISEALCALLGEPNALSRTHCDPNTSTDALHLPDSLALVGLDCQAMQPDAAEKYEQVRTAAFMGGLLIDRIVRHDQLKDVPWDGHLSRISVNDYVEKFRDRIPTKMKGREFLDRFGETDDSLTRIDPNFVYKIRSRTEHHIYEHWRAQQLFDYLSRAIHDGDEAALVEAGGLMYASHWSYGQRCGMGSIETDLLVNLIRRQGEPDLFGAKVTSRGCGGVVAVLMRTTDRALAAVRAAADAYSKQTGNTIRFHDGSIPGALLAGAARV